MLEPAEQKRRAQHEQRVGDDRAGDGGLHKHILPGAQRSERDQQLGQISQGGIEQAANHIAGPGRHGFCGAAQQSGQWHDGQDGQNKKKRVRFGADDLGDQYHRHQSQRPEQGIVPNFFE
jgi:hypothetical protein